MAFFVACFLAVSVAFGAMTEAAPQASPTPRPLNFSDRLSKSFNTAPLGKTSQHLGSTDETDDQNVQTQKPIPTPYGKNTMDWDPLNE